MDDNTGAWMVRTGLDKMLLQMSKESKMNDNLTIIRAAENAEDMQFCEVCGGEWTDELPCLCELVDYGRFVDYDDYEIEDDEDGPLY